MKRILVLSALTLAMVGGVASADRGRRHWKQHHRGGVSWSGGVMVSGPRIVAPRVVVQSRPVYVQRPHVVRRPIYVQAPAIRVRYYNYYQRPAVIAENYNTMPGYYWVAGSWSWNGYEWMWTAGHYEPDPNYVEQSYDYPPSYDGSYDQGYSYDNNYYNDDDDCGRRY
jgi:hypothetical protein